jgi:capsular polysaccharide biosynthesis protein
MVQTLPAIYWAARTSRTGKVAILAQPLSTWQRDSLRLLGLSDIPVVELHPTAQYRLRNAQFSDFVAGAMTYQVSRAIGATFRHMAARAAIGAPTGQAIYVARTDSPYRVLLNEAELIALLEKEGVRIVVPGEHTLTTQIQLFRAARLVIGLHGAGMSNIGFCEPGTVLFEILPRHFPNACFDLLAQSMGLHYHAAVFGGPADGNPLEQCWSVNMDLMRDYLSSVLGYRG